MGLKGFKGFDDLGRVFFLNIVFEWMVCSLPFFCLTSFLDVLALGER